MLYYCKTPQGNFGDDLNPWLWSRLAPEVCDPQDHALFVGIGTLLTHRVPSKLVKVVFGAGAGYGRLPRIDPRWFFYCVRGPLTATRLHLDPTLAVTDPALLVRTVASPAGKKRFKVAFMPHHQSMGCADWAALCHRAGLHCIDSRKGPDEVLPEIAQTELLLAEAMHGAIVADALRVPWIAVRMYSQFLEFKWQDWTRSIEVNQEPAVLPPIFEQELPRGKALVHTFKRTLAATGLGKPKWQRLQLRRSSAAEIDNTLRALDQLARHGRPRLSADQTTGDLEKRLLDKLSELREAWRQRRFSNQRAVQEGPLS